jgi:predicted enzyme related to lactoylglutathione lyase
VFRELERRLDGELRLTIARAYVEAMCWTGNPAAKAFQQTKFQQQQPAAMFYTDNVQRDYERMKAAGAEFTMPPTKVTASTIAMVNDTCGNLIQIAQLGR